jgi:hypothetical protein
MFSFSILSAAAEAVAWKHPIEAVSPEGKRLSPRMIFYPRDMPPIAEELEEFMKNPSDLEDGKHIAYSKILEKAVEFDDVPKFYREDSEMVQETPILAPTVPHMLNTAAQVSVGSRDFVLENGPDVFNSSHEDSPQDERGDELTGIYTNGLKAPVILSQSEVARQRAAAEGLKRSGWGKWINSDTPDSTSTTSDFTHSAPSSPAQTRCASRFDDPDVLKSHFIPRARTPTGEAPSKPTVSTAVSMSPPQTEMNRRQKFLSDSSGASGDELPPPGVLLSSKAVPPPAASPVSPSGISGPSDPSSPRRGKGKAAARPKVAAGPDPQEPAKGAGKKATVRSADQEATHPMQTRASRARGLRGVGGSGKKDTCGANGTPSKT